MGFEPGLRARAERLHVSGKLRNECRCPAEITRSTHCLEAASSIDRVGDTERDDGSSKLVRGGPQRRAVASVHGRSHGVNLHRDGLHEEFREVANECFVAVFVEEDAGIEGGHRSNCTQSFPAWSSRYARLRRDYMTRGQSP